MRTLALLALLTVLCWGARAQEPVAGPVKCYPERLLSATIEVWEASPAITTMRLDQNQTHRFTTWLEKQGLDISHSQKTWVGAILFQVNANDLIRFILISQTPPTHCMSPIFLIPPEFAQAALNAIYGRKT